MARGFLRALAVCLAVGSFSLFGRSGSGHTQALTATSTPSIETGTPLPRAPSPGVVLDRARAANKAFGSVHVVTYTLLRRGKVRVHHRTVADILINPFAIHSRDTRSRTKLKTAGPTTTVQRDEAIIAGYKMAIRTKHSGWKCASRRQLTDMLAYAVGPPLDDDSHKAKYANLGPELVGVTAVWHLRDMVRLPDIFSGTVDMYISQSDYRMLRETAEGTVFVEGKSMREKVVQNLSRWGEPLAIRLPRNC